MARLAKPKNEVEIALDKADEDLSAFAAEKVQADPRGAPITMPEPPSYEADPLDDVSAFVAPEAGPRCALDDAPVNSVLVVLQFPGEKAQVVLQTPAGQVDVPTSDLAWRLPLMAELKKTGPHTYVAVQRDDAMGKSKLVCATAVEACQQFKKHFHGERD